MDWINAVVNAIDYIEEHITEKIDYGQIAKIAYSSKYHFQRVFGITCGVTLGEYIRKRKLTLAGNDLKSKKTKVLEVALKYGYETSESFSRAFYKFHGVMPSRVNYQSRLKIFPRLDLTFTDKEKSKMNYKIEEKPQIILLGYKKRFSGTPYGEERERQEREFISSTRAKQWLLLGASCDYSTDYMVITNVDEHGYDFYVAYELDDWTRKEIFNPEITGVDFIDKLGFETIVIPKQRYVIFETPKKKYPIIDYVDMRKKIVTECLDCTDIIFADAPEVVIMHWRPKGEWAKERYIEICLPIEKS